MSVVVSVRDLEVAYGDLEVVKGVSLDVHQGEKIVIRALWLGKIHIPPVVDLAGEAKAGTRGDRRHRG